MSQIQKLIGSWFKKQDSEIIKFLPEIVEELLKESNSDENPNETGVLKIAGFKPNEPNNPKNIYIYSIIKYAFTHPDKVEWISFFNSNKAKSAYLESDDFESFRMKYGQVKPSQNDLETEFNEFKKITTEYKRLEEREEKKPSKIDFKKYKAEISRVKEIVDENDLRKRIYREEESVKKWNFGIWTSLILSVVLFFGSLYFFVCVLNLEFDKTGSFFSGVFGVIFSLIAMGFVYLAFKKQNEQLLHQQLEILLTRKEQRLMTEELQGQKKEFQEQNKTLTQQRFENTFFQMLKLHNQIVNNIQYNQSINNIVNGLEALRMLYKNLKNEIPSQGDENKDIKKIKKFVEDSYSKFFKNESFLLGHYFRNLYTTLTFVKNAKINLVKNDYYRIIRAQLSENEIFLIFYNCIASGVGRNFLELTIDIDFFKYQEYKDTKKSKVMYWDKLDKSHIEIYGEFFEERKAGNQTDSLPESTN